MFNLNFGIERSPRDIIRTKRIKHKTPNFSTFVNRIHHIQYASILINFKFKFKFFEFLHRNFEV